MFVNVWITIHPNTLLMFLGVFFLCFFFFFWGGGWICFMEFHSALYCTMHSVQCTLGQQSTPFHVIKNCFAANTNDIYHIIGHSCGGNFPSSIKYLKILYTYKYYHTAPLYENICHMEPYLHLHSCRYWSGSHKHVSWGEWSYLILAYEKLIIEIIDSTVGSDRWNNE